MDRGGHHHINSRLRNLRLWHSHRRCPDPSRDPRQRKRHSQRRGRDSLRAAAVHDEVSQQPQPRDTKDDAGKGNGGVPGHGGLFADAVDQDNDSEDDEGEDHCRGEDLCGVVVDDPVCCRTRHIKGGQGGRLALLLYVSSWC